MLRMVLLHPAAVMARGSVAKAHDMHCVDGIVEAAPRTKISVALAGVFTIVERWVESRLKMRLADQRGFVTSLVLEVLRKAWRVLRQRNTVREHAMRTHVLPGKQR